MTSESGVYFRFVHGLVCPDFVQASQYVLHLAWITTQSVFSFFFIYFAGEWRKGGLAWLIILTAFSIYSSVFFSIYYFP